MVIKITIPPLSHISAQRSLCMSNISAIGGVSGAVSEDASATALAGQSSSLAEGRSKRLSRPTQRIGQYNAGLKKRNEAIMRKEMKKAPVKETQNGLGEDSGEEELEEQGSDDELGVQKLSVMQTTPEPSSVNAPSNFEDIEEANSLPTDSAPIALATKRAATQSSGSNKRARTSNSPSSTATPRTTSPTINTPFIFSPVSSPPPDSSFSYTPLPPTQRPAIVASKRTRKQRPTIGRLEAHDTTESATLTEIVELACLFFKAFQAAAIPFPCGLDPTTMSRDAFDRANEAARLGLPPFPFTKDIGSIIESRATQLRGAIRDRIYQLIPSAYGFLRGEDEDEQQQNKYLVFRFLEKSSFTCATVKFPKCPKDWPTVPLDLETDYVERTGYFMRDLLQDAINISFFRNSKDLGVQFSTWFDPISTQTIALIFTIIEHCITEYSSGLRTKTSLNMTIDSARFQAHVANLEDYERKVPNRYHALQKRFYTYGRMYAQVQGINTDAPQASLADVEYGPDYDE